MITFLNFIRSVMAITLLSVFLISCNKRSGEPKVLVFFKTAGFYHESIPDGIAAIQKLGAENGFLVDTTSNSALFTEENLAQYSAIIWLNTTGDVLDQYQKADFERYIQAGGGFAGIHAASDTEYHWGWYTRLVGGQFFDHPGINDPHPNVQDGKIHVTDREHRTTRFLPEIWNRRDEWYSFQKLNPEVNVLMDIDEDSYLGGHKMGYHPLAWYHEYDGGRAFYTAGGHTKESYQEELFLRHILEGIQYAIGDNKKLNYGLAKTQRVPEENRFEKKTLVLGEFTEPTELTILPNLDVLIAQRRGELLLYKNGDSTVNQIAKLDVYWKTDIRGVNAEEGLMGLQKDPDFANNGFIFMFYSPADKEVNRLSRFKFENDQLNLETEQIILEFYSQRNICCHTGGSIAFDKDGLLYLSTGDNSTPFDQWESKFVNRGYAPLDNRAGYEQFDARRSAGNANDLRGKVLRIKVNPDGSYDIPEGNLYPKGTQGTRPEIFVQGTRNPYRISIDQKNNYLYWGDVGPDASNDSLSTRGPRGYDEVNQARKAGHFGWPFFVGNNFPYIQYDFVSGTSGEPYDVIRPVNDSPNNTGMNELPPAEPAFIWYHYGNTADFPQLGSGGRNAMTGPVYYTDMFPKDTRYPEYYNGKLFIYDWVRGWIKAVTMTDAGDYDKMEPFMNGTRFNALIDLEVGPDGKFYGIEYGNGWFTKNPDASLFRIDFNAGNRSPVIHNLTVDQTSGSLPFKATFSVDASDPEKDPLTYTWDLGNGEQIVTKEPRLEYTFKEIGDYDVQVWVRDPGNLQAKSQIVSVYAGNIAPIVSIEVLGNQSFYFPGSEVKYRVSVDDPDDPSARDDLTDLYVSADYVMGLDMAEASKGHLIMTDAMVGKSLISSLTCKTCHKEDEPSIGPSYVEVARKYRRNPSASDYLLTKIKNGGGGVWGETVMPANPDLKNDDAKKLVAYILSLGGRNEQAPSLPAEGSVQPTLGKAFSDNGVLILSASFTDKGGEGIKPLTGTGTVALRSPKVSMSQVTELNGVSKMNFNDTDLLILPSDEASFAILNIDLTEISAIQFTLGGQEKSLEGYTGQIRLGSPDGQLIGESVLKVSMDGPGGISFGMGRVPITGKGIVGKQDLYIVTKPVGSEEKMAAITGIEFVK